MSTELTVSMRHDLTVVIITKNEEANIESVIKAWLALAPVLLVDGDSWDQTAEVAKRCGANVIQQPWLGFGKQKQFAVDAARTAWVLSVDADEWPSDALLMALQRLSLDDPSIGYSLRRQTYFLGSRVKYSGWGDDHVLRLFNKAIGHFDDRIVHEKVIHRGTTQTLEEPLLHYSYRRQSDVQRKSARYARLSAKHAYVTGKINSVQFKAMTSPWWAVFKTLILKAGFLDGLTGIQIAKMNAKTVARKYQLLTRAIRHQRPL